RRRMITRSKAAWHELHCWECRVTWYSWLLRLFGIGGMAPLAKDWRRRRVRSRMTPAEKHLFNELLEAYIRESSCLNDSREPQRYREDAEELVETVRFALEAPTEPNDAA